MSRVSVLAGQKPKPKGSFKFLRRDEGRLSYSSTVAESPPKSATNGADGAVDRGRRGSKALREAIAYDMRNAKSHDPLGEVVVAVPRKAPPPTRAASAPPVDAKISRGVEKPEARAPPQRRQSARAMVSRRPEWVNPEVPPLSPPQAATRSEPEQLSNRNSENSSNDVYSRDTSRAAGRGPDTNGADLRQYGGFTPRSAGVGVSRYVASDYHATRSPPSSVAERNYFRRTPYTQDPLSAAGMSLPAGSHNREEDELMARLEQEVKAAQDERIHYAYARQQLDREKQRFEEYRYSTQKQIEDDRVDADDHRLQGQRDAKKDLRAAEERYKNVSAVLATERETNRHLTQENDSLRTQLEDLTLTMRETQRIHKAEVARMRRDIDSLTRRNAELLAMTKEQQLQSLQGASASPVTLQKVSSRQTVSINPSTHSTPSRSYEEGEDGSDNGVTAGARRTSRGASLVVMDFTPRASTSDTAAREKRNRQMLDRMQAEEDAMEERRRQRENRVADRKREEKEKEARHRAAVAAAASATARRQREEEDQRKAAAAATVSAEGIRTSGNKINTPRMHSGTASAKQRLPASESQPPQAPARSHHHRIPTREEMVGDLEEPPEENVPNDGVVSQAALGDNPNKKEVLYRSGKREIHYANGTLKVVLPSGHTTLHFTNGDIKRTFPSGKGTYWYEAAQTMHTQMPNGVQTFEFRSTGQTEKHLPDGSKEILYPDGIYKIVRPDGGDETFYPNGEPMEE